MTRPGGRIVMGNWIPGDPTLVAQILKISSAYTPPPPEGFVSPMTWGIESQRDRAIRGRRGSSRADLVRQGHVYLQVSRHTVGVCRRLQELLRADDERLCRRGSRTARPRIFSRSSRPSSSARTQAGPQASRPFRRRSCASQLPVEGPFHARTEIMKTSAERPTATTAFALADRLEKGAVALASFAGALSSVEWQTRIPGDGRTIGVVVHHVATMYPLEIQLAQRLAEGKPIEGLAWNAVHELNARHALENQAVTKEAALDLLRRNSAAAAAAIRALSDEELRRSRHRLAQRRCAADMSVHARGSRRAAQLSSPRQDARGVDEGLIHPNVLVRRGARALP